MNYYSKVYELTLTAIDTITAESSELAYKGYTGANAVALYLNDEHNINVADDSTANDAFCAALDD